MRNTLRLPLYNRNPFADIESNIMHHRNMCIVLGLLCTAIFTFNATADGKAKAQVCGACHGEDGNSTIPMWPKLAGQNPAYTVEQLQAFKSGRRENPAMAPLAVPLEESDMREIAAYYAAQTLRIQPVEAGKIAAGQQLYRGGNAERRIPACMACHGPSGAGNAPARYPALRGQHAEYTVNQLKAYRDGSRSTDQKRMMRTIAAKLSDADIEQVAQYISGLY